jgi:ribonuclease-3
METTPMKLLADLLEELPEELARQVFTHASWSERRSDSYARLAFLGDSVLGLAVTAYLYPRLEAERFGAGRLTKIRAQAVSGVSCRAVAERLALPERMRAAAPAAVRENAAVLVETERVLASVLEAVIGACYLHAGYERTAEAVVEAFAPEIEGALEHPVDFKSALQELLARRGLEVSYEISNEEGPPHERIYEVTAVVDGRQLGSGGGRSKKHAEQEAAREAFEELESRTRS